MFVPRRYQMLLPLAAFLACVVLGWYVTATPFAEAASLTLRLLVALALLLTGAMVWRDVRLEAALAVEHERMQRVAEAAQSGIIDVAIDGHANNYFSPRAMEILGFAGDADARRWQSAVELAHPDDRAMVRERLVDLLKHNARFDVDFRVARVAGGSYTWVNAVGV